MADKIMATFRNKKDADKAIKALKDAHIEPGTDTPENGGDTVVFAPIATPAGIAATSGNAIGPVAGTPAVPAGVDNDATDVDETQNKQTGQTVISVSVRDDAEADRVTAIVREHGGIARSASGSTLDEVANAAQRPDRTP